jgi:hypothetical protein
MDNNRSGSLAGDPSTTAEYQVEMEAHALQCAVSALWRMRLNPQYADQVLRVEGDLIASLGSLHVLCDDIRRAYDKRDQSTLVPAE